MRKFTFPQAPYSRFEAALRLLLLHLAVGHGAEYRFRFN